MEPKDYKYNKEESGMRPTTFPNAMCHSCAFKHEDYIVGGKVLTIGAEKSKCKKFEKKDFQILKGKQCPEYRKS